VRLRILELAPSPPGLLSYLQAQIPRPWEPGSPEAFPLPPNFAFHRLRQQANALAILEALPPPAPAEALLALTTTDLFLPALTFVFGASALGARRSLVSIARLRPQTPHWQLWYRRVLVEVLHELGHGLGLPHCPVAVCPMHQSFHPEAVDLKEDRFCPACWEWLAAYPPSKR